MAAEAAAAHHSLRSEITRIENNIRTASRLLEQHNNVLQRLERNKEELEHIRQTAPGQIHRQLASDNNALIEKEKKEIDKIDNILRRLYQEKKQLQTEYERQPSETPPVA